MGNHQTVPSKLWTLNSQNWVEAGQDHQNTIFSNVNPYRRRLLANIITNQLIQQYQLNFITEEDYNSYLAQLTCRQVSPQSQTIHPHNLIYPVRYFVNKSKHEMCTTIHTGYLYTDKVQLRLKQINDIPFQDLLYMYKSTLNGFKLLYEKVGYFDIVQQMIFITKSGQVKVWMNPNLAKNYPNYQKTSYHSNTSQPPHSQRQPQNIFGSQADMIRKLILMIEKNSDEFIDTNLPTQPQNQLFSEFLQDKNIFDKLSFQHSLDQFQSYLSRNNLHCPDFMRSIPELFSPDSQIPHAPTNYQLSHVNQITSQHLTQMKKKFQPMETIIEDQNVNSKTTHKLKNSYQRQNFQQSHVAMYTSPAFVNQQQHNLSHTQNRNTFRTNNAPIIDLSQSRRSHQNNHTSNDYINLQKSTKSSNNNPPFFNQKPNSVSAINYSNLQMQANVLTNNPQFQIPSQNVIISSNPHTIMNGHFGNHLQFHNPYPNEINQRIVMVSPPSFRTMNSGSNTTFQQNMYQNQPIKLPPPSSFVSFQNSHVSHQGFEQSQAINQKIKNQLQIKESYQNNNRQKINNFEVSAMNEKNSTDGSKQTQQKSSLVSNGNPFTKESFSSQTKRNDQREDKKSKLRYFTKSDSYQLDEQIANDLEKFLGLKVN